MDGRARTATVLVAAAIVCLLAGCGPAREPSWITETGFCEVPRQQTPKKGRELAWKVASKEARQRLWQVMIQEPAGESGTIGGLMRANRDFLAELAKMLEKIEPEDQGPENPRIVRVLVRIDRGELAALAERHLPDEAN